MSKFRANSVDIWKRPVDVRYIYYVETAKGLYIGTTWNSLNQAVTTRGKVINILIVDIDDQEVIQVQNIKKFLKEWRDNYYDKDWKYSD